MAGAGVVSGAGVVAGAGAVAGAGVPEGAVAVGAAVAGAGAGGLAGLRDFLPLPDCSSGRGCAKKFGGCARHGSVLALPVYGSGLLSAGILTALRVSGALMPSGTFSAGRESALPANGRSVQPTKFLVPPR